MIKFKRQRQIINIERLVARHVPHNGGPVLMPSVEGELSVLGVLYLECLMDIKGQILMDEYGWLESGVILVGFDCTIDNEVGFLYESSDEYHIARLYDETIDRLPYGNVPSDVDTYLEHIAKLSGGRLPNSFYTLADACKHRH